MSRSGLKVGDMGTYTGEPLLVSVVKKLADGTWQSTGWGELPIGVPCVIIEQSQYQGMWIVMAGEQVFRVNEKFLQAV